MTDLRTFIDHFEKARRSYVTNTFLLAVRRGARTPVQVLASVEQEFRKLLARSQGWNCSDIVERTELVCALLKEHHAEALAFAQWALAWEALTPAEKERQKGAKSEVHRLAWMQQQPATDKQRSYLKALGYHGDVTSKAHASELIDLLCCGELREVQR